MSDTVKMIHPPGGHVAPVPGGSTRDHWVHLVRVGTVGLTEEQVQLVADECMTNGRGVWHSASVVFGTVDKCPCVPCRKLRGEA